MWRFVLALIVAVGLGYLAMKMSNAFLSGSVNVLGDLIVLMLVAIGFWALYHFLSDKVSDHKVQKAHEKAVEDAYQRGLSEGRGGNQQAANREGAR